TQIFIGDIGNNSGNRTNLRIYIVNKVDFQTNVNSVMAQIINYSYSDQTNFTPATNNTNFDAEAFIYLNDSLHIFSKNWIDKKSKHYILPAKAGNYQAQLLETLNAGYLVTGASVQKAGVIVLCGYDNTGIAPVYITLLFDYNNALFFNGNKRRFNVSNALTHGQVEAIDFTGTGFGWISNERFQQSVFNVAPKLKSFNISSFLPAKFLVPNPVAGIQSNSQIICKNKTVTFTSNSSNATQLQWYFDGGLPAGSTDSVVEVQYKTTGLFDVTLIASNGFTTDTLILSNYITVNQTPKVSITALGSTVFCTGGVMLLANANNAVSYQWRKNGKPITGAITTNYLATESGSYSVTAYNTNGCARLSNVIVVNGPPVATASITGSLNICPPDSVIITATAGNMSYQWLRNGNVMTGANQQSLTVTVAGRYNVNITNSSGCMVTTPKKKVTISCRINPQELQNLIFPNPSNTHFEINSGMLKSKCLTINVFDIWGREIQSYNSENTNAWPIFGGSLKKGIYVVQVIAETATYYCRIAKN
ncbi:MAG TPA: T9SS type A sorting domain-containing protein, partial [Bacteroidia bacterium]|nr:T9SS type A sorting domain-containing protein [Bacteroidia bacterium]